nr:hypothetical protein [Tanacetum cinerariifolium]
DNNFRTERVHHYVANDEVVKSIFNSGKIKGRCMGIPKWLLTPKIMQTKAYKVNSTQENQIDVENLDEATQVSITLAKSAEEYEAQQNIKNVKEHLLNEEVNKLVEGKESDANQFADEIMLLIPSD